MSFLTLASLASTVASGVVDLAAHLSEGAARGKPSKPSGKDKVSPDLLTLANAFAAALAAASAPVAPLAVTPTANPKTATAPAKSANAVPALPMTAASPPGKQLPQIAAATVPVAAKTVTPPLAAATNVPKPTLAPVLAAKQQVPAASSKATAPTTPATPPAKPTAQQPQSAEAHLGLHTLVPTSGTDTTTTAPETIAVNHTAPASVGATLPASPHIADASAAVVATSSAGVTSSAAAASSPDHHRSGEPGSFPMPAQETLSTHGMALSGNEGTRLTSLSRIVQTAAVVSSGDGKPTLATDTPGPPNHSDSRPHSDAAPSTSSAPVVPPHLAAPTQDAVPPNPVATPAPLPVADQLTRAFLAQADVIQHGGRTDFHLRLDPPQLGSVQIHLTATEHTVSARIVVAQEGTRQLLENQAHHLRQGLAEAGLSLGSFDVTRDGGGSRGGGQQPPPQTPLLLPPPASPPRSAPTVSPPISRLTDGIDLLA